MTRTFQLSLGSVDVCQLLDGLKIRAETWQQTVQHLRTSRTSDNAVGIEECSDAVEADQIHRHYRKIIASVERQIQKQLR